MIEWRKSSRSQAEGGECVELGIDWRKSSHSQGGQGECVELGVNAVGAFRDSKRPEAPYLVVTQEVLAAFLAEVKAGKHDR
jgi:hypothetical protein